MTRSKYLDLSRRGGGGDDEPDPLEGIDFELELLRRDEINLTYIRALLMSLQRTEAEEEGRGARRAREKRQKLLDLLASEIGLQAKRPHIEAFINSVMPHLGGTVPSCLEIRLKGGP